MSGRDQDQRQGQGQGGQGQQGQGQGQQGKQKYVVKTDFTDDKGRTWTAGTAFEGDEAAIRKAVEAGQIEQKQQPA